MNIANVSSPSDWIFFANGNANCLFKYIGDEERLRGKLLRLRLQNDSASYISTRALHFFIESKLQGLFQDEMIDSELVLIPSQFSLNLRTEIPLMDDEEYGFLICNVLSGDFQTYNLSKNCALHVEIQKRQRSEVERVIVEMKPKWLYRNKTNYCRTCSLYQFKGFDRHFCSLDLIHDQSVPTGVSDLISKIPEDVMQSLENSQFFLEQNLVEFFRAPNCILKRLSCLQDVPNDGSRISSLQNQDDVSEELSMRMTLRDVGVFIEILKRNESHQNDNYPTWDRTNFFVKSFVYDLDLKSSTKFEHWVQTENQIKDIYDSYNPNWRFCSRN